MLLVTFLKSHISEYDRKRLCLALLGLNVIQMFFACFGFTLGAYISLNINTKAHLVRGYSLKPVGGTLSGCSIILFLFHCLGAKAMNDFAYHRTRPRFENKLILMITGCAIMSAAIASVSILCAVHYYKLKPALSRGMLGAMKLYSRNKHAKLQLDEIQMEYRCCGNSNHTDWFKFKWMPEVTLPSEKDVTFRRLAYRHSVPFSCCDPSIARPCFYSMVNIERGQYKYPNHSFYNRGCTQVLLEVLQEVIQATALLMLVPFFLEITIAAQTRYLQTSLIDCKKRHDPTGIGKCWLFKEALYEIIPQSKKNFHDKILAHSSSEESIRQEPLEAIKCTVESDQIFNDSQTQIKRKIRGKISETSTHDGDDKDLRQLLLKQMNKSGKYSESNGEVATSNAEKHKEQSTENENNPRKLKRRKEDDGYK